MKKIFGMCFFAALLLNSAAWAQGDKIGKHLPATEYRKGETIAKFLYAAFSERLWNDDIVTRIDGKITNAFAMELNKTYLNHEWGSLAMQTDGEEKEFSNFSKYYPSFAQYSVQAEGLPDHNTVKKWSHPVTIGYGIAPYIGFADGRTEDGEETRSQRLVRRAIEDFLPRAESATHLDITFSPEPEKNSEDLYNTDIRFLITDKIYPRYYSGGLRAPHGGLSLEDIEVNLWGATAFDVSNRSDIDGYILSGRDNIPRLAICQIKNDEDDAVLVARVQECAVHAMGLVGSLGNQNVTSDIPDSNSIVDTQTLMALLYCPEIESGMGKNRVLEIIMSHESSCIGEILERR